jgi:dGTPase
MCDEIAYNTADLDDGYLAGLVTMEAARDVDKFRELDDAVRKEFPDASERVRLHEIVRGLINWLVSGLIEGTIEAARGLKDVDAVRARPHRVACFSSETAAGSGQLKDLLRRVVYESDLLVVARKDSIARIEKLFDRLLESPDLLPVNYLQESAGRPLHRVVCDYIAGMTDGFLLRTFSQLFPHTGV